MDLRKLVDSNPTPPLNQGGEDVIGPVEEGQHPTLGSVKPVDVEPHLAGKSLGKHLSKRSIGGWILALIKSPKAFFHLASGKLEQMRENKPEKYLKELCNLATTKSDWQFVFTEAQSLRTGAHPELQEKLQGWQYVAFGEIAERAPTMYMDEFIEHLSLVGRLAEQMDSIPFMHSPNQPSSGIQQLNHMVVRAARRATPNNAARILHTLEPINDRIQITESVGNSPLTHILNLLEKKASSGVIEGTVSDVPKDMSGQYSISPPDTRFETLRSGDLPTISELEYPDELTDIHNTLLNSPNDAEAWSDYHEIESELTAAAKLDFFKTLYKTHPNNLGIATGMLFHRLLATPEKKSLWDFYDKLSSRIPMEDQVAFLEPMFKRDPHNNEVRIHLILALKELSNKDPYARMLEKVRNDS